ncbi:hypothetical protein AZI85_11925 [Bdellovibrio bacteriovorus]|uniref:Orotate phosphoribosyltransferase n=1 Tax=Bdellovibrio bacteriovorus TaxID=959 RepID=A0A150WCR4_BDEBC|nr:DUF3015 family protein [Bdellovibrio bacteriovorus]KYG60697.1 hypothetical protein AZI85_11925 [Bdellovibrio bacteriovorus]
MKKLILSFIVLFGANAWAAGDAGCGLGSMVISKNTKLLQLFAMTTNNTTLTQPFGITSGTSGCNAHGLVMAEKEVQYFVEVNQEDLSREMAQGHGEKLATLAQMKGCRNEASQKAFGTFTQSSYERIIPAANTTASDLVQNLNRELATQGDLNTMCHGS